MAHRKIYAVRYKYARYHRGLPFTIELKDKLYNDVVNLPESKRDIVEIATTSLRKAKWYERNAQEQNGYTLSDNTEKIKGLGIRPTYTIEIRFYYIDVLPSI